MRRTLPLIALLAACAEPAACPRADLAPLDARPAYVFVASDYASSAIGLLDAEGELVREAWLDSGTVPPGLVTPLGGDAVLASGTLSECVVAVIDRFGTDVVTFLDVCAREPLLGQLVVGTGSANPRDVIALDERRALVSRYSSNQRPDAQARDRGNDLLVIDWRDRRVLSRIDLSPLDVLAPETILARPDRMGRLTDGDASAILVGLGRLSADYMVAGPGAVAVVDTNSLAVRALPIEGLVNCGEVDAVPGRPELAVVTCAGPPFVPAGARREGAGVVLLELAQGEVRVRAGWRAAQHPDAPVFNAWSVPLAADRIVSVAMGDLAAGSDDCVGVIDPGADEAEVSMHAGDAFVLGDGAFDPDTGLLLVPDADRGAMRRFAVDERGIAELTPVFTAPCRGLPPREVRRITWP